MTPAMPHVLRASRLHMLSPLALVCISSMLGRIRSETRNSRMATARQMVSNHPHCRSASCWRSSGQFHDAKPPSTSGSCKTITAADSRLWTMTLALFGLYLSGTSWVAGICLALHGRHAKSCTRRPTIPARPATRDESMHITRAFPACCWL